MNGNELSSSSQTTLQESKSSKRQSEELIVEEAKTEENKESVNSLSEELTILLKEIRALNRPARIWSGDSISRYYQAEKSSPLLNPQNKSFLANFMLGDVKKILEREDHLFLNHEERKALTIITYAGERYNRQETPPPYQIINSLLERAESETVDTMNRIYRSRLVDPIETLEKILKENTERDWKAEFNRLSRELKEKDAIIMKKDEEINSARMIIYEKVISLK